jgi:predicted TIM-barrel fold metal-dependent hydrolase
MTTRAIADLDQHASDLTIPGWADAVPRDLRHLAPRSVFVDGVERLGIEDKAFPRPKGPGVGSPRGSGAGGAQVTMAERVDWMDANGVEWAILTPGNLGMALHAVEDLRLRHAIGHRYREWQLDEVSKAPDRFVAGLLVDPFSLPTREQVRHAHAGALFMRPTHAQGLHLWEEPMRGVLKLASDTGLPLMLHGGTGYYQQSPVADQYDNYFYTHLFSHVVEMQMALAELVGHGLLAEYDGLRVVFVEAGVAWVPSFVARLQWHVKHLARLIPGGGTDVLRLLSERCLFSVFNEDAEGLGRLLTENPWLHAAVGSDFPHWDTMALDEVLREVPASMHADIAGNNLERLLPRIPRRAPVLEVAAVPA